MLRHLLAVIDSNDIVRNVCFLYYWTHTSENDYLLYSIDIEKEVALYILMCCFEGWEAYCMYEHKYFYVCI